MTCMYVSSNTQAPGGRQIWIRDWMPPAQANMLMQPAPLRRRRLRPSHQNLGRLRRLILHPRRGLGARVRAAGLLGSTPGYRGCPLMSKRMVVLFAFPNTEQHKRMRARKLQRVTHKCFHGHGPPRLSHTNDVLFGRLCLEKGVGAPQATSWHADKQKGVARHRGTLCGRKVHRWCRHSRPMCGMHWHVG
jgi:hypothetical protein